MKQIGTIQRDQLDGVMAFLKVAERQNFRAAAAELGISPSAISQIVRGLEARAGVPLFTRTTRKVALTEAGRRFLERARPAVAELLGAFESAQSLGDQVTGLLRINTPNAMLPFLLEPIFAQFARAHPGLQVELFADDRLADIVGDGFDAGVRLGEYLHADMVALPLTPPFRFVVVGSPAYFAEMGRPRRPEDIGRHRCIGFRHQPRGALYRWEFEEGERAFDIAVDAAAIVNDSDANIRLAVMGLGLAYVAEPLVEAELADGRLKAVLTAFSPGSPGMFLYYPSRAQALPKLRALVDFLRGWSKTLR